MLDTKVQSYTGKVHEEISRVIWAVYFLTMFLHTTNFLDDNDMKNVKSTFQIVPLCHMSAPSGKQPFDMLSTCEYWKS
jgi:exosortase/archaeosortase